MLTSKQKRFLNLPTLAFASLLIMTSASNAQQADQHQNLFVQTNFIEDTGDSQRIDFSGKLRMLSQRIPAAACNLKAGIATAESGAVLEGATVEFERILNALTIGDVGLGIIGEEKRRRTLHAIDEVRREFDPLLDVVNRFTNGDVSEDAIQQLADGNMELLGAAQILVAEVSRQYANQAVLLQADIMAIDLAGRQRMLTQKISKEICFILSGIAVTESTEALNETVRNFEDSLHALQVGMPSVGLRAAPTEEIELGLEDVQNDWLAVRPFVDAINAGQALSKDDRSTAFLGLNKTLIDMNRVVGLYSAASKLGL
jgi:hypothetical protein